MALAFSGLGLLALVKGRRDLAIILAAGMLAFPIEWALKYLTAIPQMSLGQLASAVLNVNGVGLDKLADFPAGHALRATALYGLAAFCIARLSLDRRQGLTAYAVALVLIGAISLTRVYLLAHYPMDVLGGWMAGAALVAIIVAVHVMRVDERRRLNEAVAAPAAAPRTVASRCHSTTCPAAAASRPRWTPAGSGRSACSSSSIGRSSPSS